MIGVKCLLRQRMFTEQEGKCWICGELMLLEVSSNHDRFATFDHILAVSLGGKWEESNLKLAHKICNQRRGDGRSRTPSDVWHGSDNALPFSAAWLQAKGYMKAR